MNGTLLIIQSLKLKKKREKENRKKVGIAGIARKQEKNVELKYIPKLLYI